MISFEAERLIRYSLKKNRFQVVESAMTGLTDDDVSDFYENWRHFDPNATGYILHKDLPTFLAILSGPLRIEQSDLDALNIPVVTHKETTDVEKVNHASVMKAAIKFFFKKKSGELDDRAITAGSSSMKSMPN